MYAIHHRIFWDPTDLSQYRIDGSMCPVNNIIPGPDPVAAMILGGKHRVAAALVLFYAKRFDARTPMHGIFLNLRY